MGAKQSKRSVDITTTPKKGDGDIPVEGEGKLEKIAEPDVKTITNGAIHSEIEYADKEDSTKETEQKEVNEAEAKQNGVNEPEEVSKEETRTEEPKTPETDNETLNESASVEKSQEGGAGESNKAEESTETKKTKKEKKKKWSFRSISFSKKDKSKPNKEAEKNEEVKEVAEENAESKPTHPSEPQKPEEVSKCESAELAAQKQSEEKDVTEMKVAEGLPEVEPSESVKEIIKVEGTSCAVNQEHEVEKKLIEGESVKEEPSPNVEETKPEESKVSEKETNEVRSEEIPPPLPSSNPPSPVTAFAESTKENSVPIDHLPVELPVNVETVESMKNELSEVFQTQSESDTTSSQMTCQSVSNELNVTEISQNPTQSSLSPSEPSEELESLKPNLVENPVEDFPSPINDQNKTEPMAKEFQSPSTKTESPEPTTPPSTPATFSETNVENKSFTDLNDEPISTAISSEVTNVETINTTENIEQSNISSELNVTLNLEQSPISSESQLNLENSEPSKTEISEPPKTEISEPSRIEISEPSKTEISEPSKTEISEPSKTELSESSQKEQNSVADVSLPESDDLKPSTDTFQGEPVSESVVNADSLPDISTESLPSLPEPISEGLPEPVSLPPMEAIPEPIATDINSSPNHSTTPLTNGNSTDNMLSPTVIEDDIVASETASSKEGLLKQVTKEIDITHKSEEDTKEIPTGTTTTVEE